MKPEKITAVPSHSSPPDDGITAHIENDIQSLLREARDLLWHRTAAHTISGDVQCSGCDLESRIDEVLTDV